MSSDDAKKLPEVTTTFGVSGYLMESDVLIWDRATQSIWSQVSGEAVAGPRAGTKLEQVVMTDTTWKAWKKAHPKTKVLKGPKPVQAYRGGYAKYHATDRVMFPVTHKSDALKNKAVVTGVHVGDQAVCWSHEAVAAAAKEIVDPGQTAEWTLETGGELLLLRYDTEGDALTVSIREGEDEWKPLPAMRLYWFAWFTFNPKTTIEEPPSPPTTDR